MKVRYVSISNFRGIRTATLSNLKSLVVIAGANGSGKSCILDAFRLLKSVYGGYQQNEYHNWFGEFQINFSTDPKSFERLLNDKSKPMHLEIHIELDEAEKRFIRQNLQELVTLSIWRQVAPEIGWSNILAAPLATQFRSQNDEVQNRVRDEIVMVAEQLSHEYVKGVMKMIPGSAPTFENSKLLEIVFSSYYPGNIGLIDYHGPHRLFSREQISNINVDLNNIKEQRKQSSIYNYNAKYSNVKSEMAALYVREALARQAGALLKENEDVTKTLQELFQTFFPDKEFLGPRPTLDGGLEFPVRVGGREEHDLDELSSGEKEILYGYLRLRNSAPQHSIILLDEPELHLNPSLTRRLPDFYNRHLAISQDNQVWLITHSDAMLRESVGNNDYSVFHMAPSAYRANGENQIKPITAAKEFEAAIVDLLGDLATYKPGAKLVVFEGAEDAEFDVRMTAELFPKFAAQVNCISGTNKNRVRGLYETLERMTKSGAISVKVFAVTDADADHSAILGANDLRWDRYHIENYLLEPRALARVLAELRGPGASVSDAEAEGFLHEAAKDTLLPLVVHKVQSEANDQCVKALNLRVNPNSCSVATDVSAALESSLARLVALHEGALSLAALEEIADQRRREYEADLDNGNWRRTFRGRSILKRVAERHGGGSSYVVLRNLILARMRDMGFEPAGMKAVLDKVLGEN